MIIEQELSEKVVGALIEAHRILGPGLLESAYEQCLCHEFSLRGIPFKRQVDLPVEYKGIKLDCGYRMDIVVDGKIVLELKCVSAINEVDEAQLLTYLKISGIRVGYIVNFSVPIIVKGLKRIVN